MTAHGIRTATGSWEPHAYRLIREFERLGLLNEITARSRGRRWVYARYLQVSRPLDGALSDVEWLVADFQEGT